MMDKTDINPNHSDVSLQERTFGDQIFGNFKTIIAVPTLPPKNYLAQIVFYTDSLTAPSVYKLYFYSPSLHVWKSVTLS
jgi:hypothetical protein